MNYGIWVCKDSNRNETKYIMRQRWNITPKNHSGDYFRIQFPLDLAYALTIHKIQGFTLDDVILDMKNVWQSGQAYVAISRVKDDTNLKIISYDKENIKIDQYYKALLKWFRAVDHFHDKDETVARPIPREGVISQDLVQSSDDEESGTQPMDTYSDFQSQEPLADYSPAPSQEKSASQDPKADYGVVKKVVDYIRDRNPPSQETHLLNGLRTASRNTMNRIIQLNTQYPENLEFKGQLNPDTTMLTTTLKLILTSLA
ncbi:hypothetical protein B4U80_07768 [Leptotrombidium deliense]|uniref:ATP-dependent DNA helicase PIF1-like protein n=1 Tax=Leptotrombidium deliense TaxID=299467 RepID=A0A443RTY5_9ACAR|nr:hypothetical protein B4U80_07768 [Leptotrombidium deliense]